MDSEYKGECVELVSVTATGVKDARLGVVGRWTDSVSWWLTCRSEVVSSVHSWFLAPTFRIMFFDCYDSQTDLHAFVKRLTHSHGLQELSSL